MAQQWHQYTVVFANGKQAVIDIVKDQTELRSARSTAARWALELGTSVVSVNRTK